MEFIGPVHCKGHFVRNGTEVKLNGAMKASYRSLDAGAECVFSYEFEEGTSLSTSHVPPSGVYVGKTFSYSGEFVEDKMSLSFEQILDGFYSVTGKGSHHEVEYRVYGTFDIKKNELKIIRKRRLHINAPVRSKADDQPSSISRVVPPNKRRKSKIDEADLSASKAAKQAPKRRKRKSQKDPAAEQASKRRKKQSRKKDPAATLAPKKHVPFEQRVEDLRKFKAEHGNVNVPQGYDKDPSLATWVMHLRTQYKAVQKGEANSLTQEGRIATLESLGFQWIRREQGERKTFEQHLEDLREFKRIKGHANVPRGYAEDRSLATWVKNLRTQYKAVQKGETNSLTPDHIDTLEAEGFQWSINERKTFEQRLEDLRKFKVEHRHVNVPQHYDKDRSLGIWVMRLRALYKAVQKGETNSLTPDHIATLEALGFQWSAREAQWHYWFGELVKYMAANGGSAKVNVVDEHTLHLRRWTYTQRELYNRTNDDNECLLDEKREALLKGIKFDFYKRERTNGSFRIEWKMLHEMLPVIEEFGHYWFSLDKAYGSTRNKF